MAKVHLEVVAHRGADEYGSRTQILASETHRLGAGRHTLKWQPNETITPGTYVLRLDATDAAGLRLSYREHSPGRSPSTQRAPIVRILDVEAAFARRSYAAGERATLVVATDAERVEIQVLHCGAERVPTSRNDELKGVVMGKPMSMDWSGANGPRPIVIDLGGWPPGVYCARVETDNGRLGFAPFVLRPRRPTARVAIVVATSTWQAYNFYDANLDGFGDSWYVSPASLSIDLTRPYLNRGVPYRFRSYDLAFLHWLTATGKNVDVYADEDLDRFSNASTLRAAYDLIAFPGHTEYVTEKTYELIEGFRDLGGNLLFLSANNFFRCVTASDERLELVGLWRDLGRPESALCGVQYRASDRGQRQAPYVVAGANAAPWAFEGTGLTNGSAFGLYGIEIDSTTEHSPPGSKVLARIPDLFGPGRTAEMTYYETSAGARVFSAGTLNFGGQVALWPETRRLLENVWRHLTSD